MPVRGRIEGEQAPGVGTCLRYQPPMWYVWKRIVLTIDLLSVGGFLLDLQASALNAYCGTHLNLFASLGTAIRVKFSIGYQMLYSLPCCIRSRSFLGGKRVVRRAERLVWSRRDGAYAGVS